MKHVTQLNDWSFELKLVYARKCLKYGKPYTANAAIIIVNGIANIELTLTKDKLQYSDCKTIYRFLQSLGFTKDTIKFNHVKEND